MLEKGAKQAGKWIEKAEQNVQCISMCISNAEGLSSLKAPNFEVSGGKNRIRKASLTFILLVGDDRVAMSSS
jgi:hypothetical protein